MDFEKLLGAIAELASAVADPVRQRARTEEIV